MQLIKIATVVSAALLLASCSSQPPVASIEFNYKVENANAAGIVQVFDMTGNTVVQIRDIDSKDPVFLDEKQRKIHFQIVGQTAILTGLHPTFTVISGMASSKVVRVTDGSLAVTTTPAGGRVAAVVKIAPGPVAAELPAEGEMKTQLAAMKAELALLKQQMANATSVPDASQPASRQQRYAAVTSSKPISSLQVQFKDNSTDFDPKPALAATLVDLTKDAAEISITGYTDSATPSPASVRLAKARATAAGKYLVSKGVDKNKISVNFHPAGGFIAENKTREGREKNRRVEIVII